VIHEESLNKDPIERYKRANELINAFARKSKENKVLK
jgi:hypothetical protein